MGIQELTGMFGRLLFAASAAVSLLPADACTAIIVGKKASTTGRVIVGHNEDDRGFGRIAVRHGWVPPRDWPEGSVLPAEKGFAAIPQVPHTLGFFWTELKTAEGEVPNADMFLNERGVIVVSDSAGKTKEDLSDASRLTDGGIQYNLRRCVAERAKSARDAVGIIGELVERYGYVPSGRIYTVADADEGWQVQVVSGRRYVAMRCPDDSVCVTPNHYTIHGIPDRPSADCVFSADIVSYAVGKGWCEAGAPFDFAAAYQHPDWVCIPLNTRRQNFLTPLLLGREWTDETYPFCVKAERRLSPQDLMKVLTAHPEGSVRHVDDRESPSACRVATMESIVCDFGATPEATLLHVAGNPPCTHPYAAVKPLVQPLPAKFDDGDAPVRLERHFLPEPDIFAKSSVGSDGVDLEFLLGLLRIRSETMDKAANNAAVEYLKAWLEPRGVFCHVLTNEMGRTCLYAATLPGKQHDYLFVSHIDVVPADDPGQYEPRIDGDWLYARGACDTKGNVAVICMVLANLAGKASVGAFIATDEDGPTEGGTKTPVLTLREGFVPRKFVMVGDSAGEEPDQLFTAEKGHVRITITARGKGGHSSRPWALDNPIPKLTAAHARLEAKMPPRPTAGEKWLDCLSPTMLKGSDANNKIPDEASMVFSLRYTEPEGVDKWLKFVAETTGLETKRSESFLPPVVTDPSDGNVQALFSALKRHMPAMRLGKMSAATHAAYYAHLGIPVVIYAPTGYGPHAPDERVSISSLSDYTVALTEFLSCMRTAERPRQDMGFDGG